MELTALIEFGMLGAEMMKTRSRRRAFSHRQSQPGPESLVMPVEPTVTKPVQIRGAILLPWQPASPLAPHVLSTAGKSGLGRRPAPASGRWRLSLRSS